MGGRGGGAEKWTFTNWETPQSGHLNYHPGGYLRDALNAAPSTARSADRGIHSAAELALEI